MTRQPMAVLLAFFLALAAQRAGAVPFSQGFETDNAGWDVYGGSYDAVRVASGTGGITAKTGNYYGQVTTAATRWGGSGVAFADPGYTTSLAIYLDVNAGFANDKRFDFSSALNKADGSFLRDFVFNGGFYNDASGPGAGQNRFVFSASNNAGRSNAYPKNPGRDPIAITASGWYTFEHSFDQTSGTLVGLMRILDAANNLVHSWTLSNPADTTLTLGVAKNRYGWFATNELPFLAIDDTLRLDAQAAVAMPEPTVAGLAALALSALALASCRRR